MTASRNWFWPKWPWPNDHNLQPVSDIFMLLFGVESTSYVIISTWQECQESDFSSLFTPPFLCLETIKTCPQIVKLRGKKLRKPLIFNLWNEKISYDFLVKCWWYDGKVVTLYPEISPLQLKGYVIVAHSCRLYGAVSVFMTILLNCADTKFLRLISHTFLVILRKKSSSQM